MDDSDARLTDALAYLRRLPPEGTTTQLPIAEAALALSSINNPELALDGATETLGRMRAVAAQHVIGASSTLVPEAQIAIVRDILHLQFGFRGDTETYDDLQNCDLRAVLERRQGLPVALSILAMHIGDALKIDVQGISLPGHFLVALKHTDGDVLFDPFDQCRIMSEATIVALLDRVAGQHNGLKSLVPATRRDTLVRLSNNRKTRLLRQGRHDEALVVQEAMLILQPEQFTLWYEACLIATDAHNYNSAVNYLEQAMMLTEDMGILANLGALRQQIKGSIN